MIKIATVRERLERVCPGAHLESGEGRYSDIAFYVHLPQQDGTHFGDNVPWENDVPDWARAVGREIEKALPEFVSDEGWQFGYCIFRFPAIDVWETNRQRQAVLWSE